LEFVMAPYPSTGVMPAYLMLEDGRLFEGYSAGVEGESFGELVFNTAMTGYQEILTDPSYRGQVVMMTYPEIGNYGINLEDVESQSVQVSGFVVRRLSPMTSSWRAAGSLQAWLKDNNVLCIEGVDTRALTRHLRQHGAMRCGLSTQPGNLDAFLQRIKHAPHLHEQALVEAVTSKTPYTLKGLRADETQPWLVKRLVVVDFGLKQNILRCLQAFVEEMVVLPASSSFEMIESYQPDLVFLSNGPGDPRCLPQAIAMAQELIAQSVPVFGICLGHQILALALGLKVEKMKFGHHGGNHPVHDLDMNRITITSQNHGYCVMQDEAFLAEDSLLQMTHVNLNDGTVEGFRHKEKPVAAVQFHPEAAPGPHDAFYLFQRFLEGLRRPVTTV
jgi:carbamoyl-phosphate synthase small subunit